MQNRKTKFLNKYNMLDLGVFIEQDISDKK